MEPILAALVFPRLNEYLGIFPNSCLGVRLVGGHFLFSISMTRISARRSGFIKHSNTTRWWLAISQFSISAIFTYIHPFCLYNPDFNWLNLLVSCFNPYSLSRKSIFWVQPPLFSLKLHCSLLFPSSLRQELRSVVEERQLRRQLTLGAKAQDVVTLDAPRPSWVSGGFHGVPPLDGKKTFFFLWENPTKKWMMDDFVSENIYHKVTARVFGEHDR